MQNNTVSIIKVIAYSGYKANERPLSVSFGNHKIEIIRIIDRWTDPDRDYFSVQGDDGKFYIMDWNRELDIWHISEKAV